jgi:hypothetical protein
MDLNNHTKPRRDTMPHIHANDLRGKTGRIYIARKGTITVIVLDDGKTYWCNNTSFAQQMFSPVAPDYWIHSIDWAGNFSDYMVMGMIPDGVDQDFYPAADPLVPITEANITKLRSHFTAA